MCLTVCHARIVSFPLPSESLNLLIASVLFLCHGALPTRGYLMVSSRHLPVGLGRCVHFIARDFSLSSSLPVPTLDRSPLKSRPFLVLHVAPRDIGSYGRRVCLLRLHFFFPFFSAQTACSF